MDSTRYHRILVQVTDDEISDEMLGRVMSTMLRPTSGRIPSMYGSNADISVINNNALSLTKKNAQSSESQSNRVMYFDCVGHSQSVPLRNELSNLFDFLLIDQRNCCLVQVKPLRETPSNFLNNVLVPEVDKRLQMLLGTMTLGRIKLEYYGIRKYDVVNMFELPKARRGSANELYFRNTRELLRWTQGAYPVLWSYGSEHDCFDLQFDFIPTPNHMNSLTSTSIGTSNHISVKLSVLQFYMSKMDGDMRVGLRNFLENVHQPHMRMKHSILTDYLREYFFGTKDSWHIWMLFEVPSVNYGCSLANDMLTLASAAYAGVHNTKMFLNNSGLNLIYAQSPRPGEMPRQAAGQAASGPGALKNRPTSIAPPPTKVVASKVGNYSLSFWYCRIDESYVNVVTSMERYYDRKYELKVQKMCGDLKLMTHSIDADIQTKDIFDDSDINCDETLQFYLKQYKDALAAFRTLIEKVERTKYADSLKIFVKTKNKEITKETRKMKVRLLELCQARLSNAINAEVKTLNSDKSINVRMSENLLKAIKST